MWTFDLGYFIGGIFLLIAGTLIVVFHQKIADNLAGGVASYNKVKLFGLGACAVGFIFIAQIHTFLIRLFMHIIMPSKF